MYYLIALQIPANEKESEKLFNKVKDIALDGKIRLENVGAGMGMVFNIDETIWWKIVAFSYEFRVSIAVRDIWGRNNSFPQMYTTKRIEENV